MERFRTWRALGVLVVTIAVAACGTTVAPTPSALPGQSASPGPSASPPPTPVPDGSRWDIAGALELGRASTHAVVLSDGRVLVVGNDNICTPGGAWDESVQAEVFDPSTGTWSATGSLNAPRTDFVAVALTDGRVLVTGGLTSVDNPLGEVAYSSTKLYDPETGTWSASGLLNIARTEPVAALLPDGTVLVAGGAYVDEDQTRALASAEIFDPDTGTWSRTGDLRAARRGARAVTLADGRVLVVGGSSTGRNLYFEYTALSSAEIYDPATGAWTPAGSLAGAREGFSLVALPDGGALVAGGLAPSGDAVDAERLDPRTLRWAAAGSMLDSTSGRVAIVLGDGRVLVAGGVRGREPETDGNSPLDTPAIADAELYDPATGTWTSSAPLPEPRGGATAVTLADGSILVVGGHGGLVGEPSTPWCPDPAGEAVRYIPGNLASFPEPEPKPIAAAVARSSVPRAAADPAEAKRAATSITAFGIDLYRLMLTDGTLDPKGNAVFSPTSIALALGMARAGAKGPTAAEMDEVLHTAGWDALGRGLNALEQALAARDATWKDEEGTTHELKLRIANAAFAQRGWSIVQPYLDAIAATFGAGIRLVDYIADPEAQRKVINAWVKQKTAGRIPNLIPDPPPPVINELTRLVLVNAIYLKANWELVFEEADTKPRAFTRLDGSTVNVPTMLLQGGGQDVPLATGSGWKATELRYLGAVGESSWDQSTPLVMTLIMPDRLPAFEKSLTSKALTGVIAKLDAQRKRLADVTTSGEDMDCGTYAYSVRLFMPKFGIDTAASLPKSLGTLGMPLAFDRAEADFSGIHVAEGPLDRIHISDVIHQANIDVDEKGTEAAAATAVVIMTGGCTGPNPAKTVTFRLDRPFLFLLRDVQTGAVLFMGRVVDPTAK
jgi:serpin B